MRLIHHPCMAKLMLYGVGGPANELSCGMHREPVLVTAGHALTQGGKLQIGAPHGNWQMVVVYRGKHDPVWPRRKLRALTSPHKCSSNCHNDSLHAGRCQLGTADAQREVELWPYMCMTRVDRHPVSYPLHSRPLGVPDADGGQLPRR